MSFVKYEPKGNIAYLIIDREKALKSLFSKKFHTFPMSLQETLHF